MARFAEVKEYRPDAEGGPELDVTFSDDSDVVAVDWLCPAGDDSAPVAGDVVMVTEREDESGEFVASAVDDDVDPEAEAGEKRIYARGPDGAVTASVFLHGDGSIDITTDTAEITIDATGAIKLSGTSVAMRSGADFGQFLGLLHAGITTWVPVPQDGGKLLKDTLTANGWLALAPPGP
jgi:hypothetical protein